VLLCPQRHVPSFAAMGRPTQLRTENVLGQLEAIIRRIWQRPVHLFEHGNAHDLPRVACSVEHAHLHLVPTAIDPLPFIEDAVEWQPWSAEESLANTVGQNEYLRYRTPDGRWLVSVTAGEPIPSQLMRRAFVAALGYPVHWNWREDPRRDVLGETWRQLAAAKRSVLLA
jgi:ATP adenylyltransferase